MKKTSKILLIFIITLFTFLGIKVFAEDSNLSLESVKITAPEAGIYGVGQEITITFHFNKPIKGQMPKYAIYFGDAQSEKIELETENLTDFSSDVTYKYKIKSGDNGELKPEGFVNTSECQIQDENGKTYMLTSPFMTRFENKILADTTIKWTDFNNAQLSIYTENTNRNGFHIKLDNATLSADNDYYVHLSHLAEESIILKDSNDVYNNFYDNGTKMWQTTLNRTDSKVYCDSDIRNLFAEAGDIYITICEIDKETYIPKIVLKSKKIERPSFLPITQRITAYFFKDETNTFCWEIHGENERKVNYKIGKVNDIELLKSLKNGESSAYQKLMEYAKKSEAIATGTVKLGTDKTIMDKLNLVDDEYYFVYLELDTEEGKYYTIEDVSLYQALVNKDLGIKNLASIVDKDFKWNLDDEKLKEEKDTTISKNELPNTGITIITVLAFLTLITISLIAFRKYKSYKDIN